MSKISIGIPAYNEEANIAFLLTDVMAQKNFKTLVAEIIVIDDGSTDNTSKIVKNFKSKHIKLVTHRKRRGLAETLNHIFSISNSGVLVVINADSHIKDTQFIKKLSNPILTGKADLTSAALTEAGFSNIFEEILYTGLTLKSQIVRAWKKGNNVLTCYGVARAFSKKLYSSLSIPTSIGEDAYSYFYTTTKGYKYLFVKNTEIYYKPSSNYSDHRKQTLRFFKSQEIMNKLFGQKIVEENYKVPMDIVLKKTIYSIIKKPVLTILYFATVIASKIIAQVKPFPDSPYWEVSKSSKNVNK